LEINQIAEQISFGTSREVLASCVAWR